MHFEIEKYPYNKDCALAITIDDLHPEDKNNKTKLDFGYDFKSRFWNQILDLKENISEIKFTIFTVANWIDREDFPSGIFFPLRKIFRKRQSYQVDSFKLSNSKFKNWIEKLNELAKDGSIEYALHGLLHHNQSLRGAHSQEFTNLTTEEIKERSEAMQKIFKESGLNYSLGFRPPGWGLNEEKIIALSESGIKYVAASSDFKTPIYYGTTRAAGLHDVSLYDIEQIESTINFNANCFPHQHDRAVQIARKNGIIIIHCHIAPTEYGLKYVDAAFSKNVQKIIREIQYQTGKSIWFATLNEITDFKYALEKITTREENGKLFIKNNYNEKISGLTIAADNQKYIIKEIPAHREIEFDPSNFELEPVKVSAILTVYNGQNNVLPSLQSLCDQNYKNLEIIVVNDGSTDETAEILQNYIEQNNDSRITVINQNNGGRSNARNNGFKKSSGEIITFCEDDALYTKDYIKDCVAHFDGADSKLGGVIGPHYVWNRDESLNTKTKDIERRRNFYNYNPKSTWFYTREVFESIGMFNEDLELVEDVEPAIKLARQGYRFEYEPKAIWLHKEPANLRKYLRRKYRGGIGMNLFVLEGLKKTIVPPIYPIILINLVILLAALLIISPFSLLIGLLFLPFVLVMLRFKTYLLSLKISPDPVYIVLLSIYIEYLWWAATFLGYIRGSRMSREQINKLLKGR